MRGSVLTAGYTAPVWRFRTSTAALEITAPAGSATVPVMVPRSWANAAQAHKNRHTVNNSDFIRIFLNEVELDKLLLAGKPARIANPVFPCAGANTLSIIRAAEPGTQLIHSQRYSLRSIKINNQPLVIC